MTKVNLHAIRPYGDHLDDGLVQLTLTLPIPPSDEAREAARLYLEKLGFRNPKVHHMELAGEGFSFFVAHAEATATLDVTRVHVPKPKFPFLPHEELLKRAREEIRRKIVVVGGTPGSDAHTVGIDAILSIKGIRGDKGLEYYPCFQVVNLRAQVSLESLVAKVKELHADALLVSQLVTQQDQHLKNLHALVRLLAKEEGVAPHLLKIVGGPRMDHRVALSVGFDGGFGPGTLPSEVANFIVHELIRRLHGRSKEKGNLPEGNLPKGEEGMEGHPQHPAPPKRRSLFGWLGGGSKDS